MTPEGTMSSIPLVKSVPEDLLWEVWRCAHLVVLHRRRDHWSRRLEDPLCGESVARFRDALSLLSDNEWGREAIMACYQRAIAAAIALDDGPLHRICGITQVSSSDP
jgi:hypothetical protein